MNCASCGQDIAEGNAFCGKCGAHAGQTVEETAGERIKTRRVVEVEIFDAVLERVGKWMKWLGIPLAVLAGVMVFIFGKAFFDVRSTVESARTELAQTVQQAKSQIEPLVVSSKKDLTLLQTQLSDTKHQYGQVQADLTHYRQVNQRIEQLQRQLATVQGQIENWYNAMETEVFDAPSPTIRFIAGPKTSSNPNETPFTCELTLKKTPIPASLRIIRRALIVSANLIKVEGKKVSFVTYTDSLVDPADTVVVQYHAKR